MPNLFSRFLKPSGVSLGLDVGSFSIKGVLMARGGKGPRLLKTAIVPLPPGAVAAKRALVIQQAVHALAASHARIATALSGPGTVLRLINLPKMTPQELRTALDFEAEKYIPFKLKETNLDFSILGERPDGRMELFLVAARKELVHMHLEVLNSAKVMPAFVDLEALALANSWEATHPQAATEEVVGLIHIGARGTILDFVKGPQFQFSREIPIGGDVFTQALMESLQVDRSQAEELKCDPKERAKEFQMVFQPYWEEWLNQCRVSFDFYENQFGHHLSRLALSGGSARLHGFQEWIQQVSGLPAEEWDPLEGFALEADRQLLELHRPSFTVAIGLAVRELV